MKSFRLDTSRTKQELLGISGCFGCMSMMLMMFALFCFVAVLILI